MSNFLIVVLIFENNSITLSLAVHQYLTLFLFDQWAYYCVLLRPKLSTRELHTLHHISLVTYGRLTNITLLKLTNRFNPLYVGLYFARHTDAFRERMPLETVLIGCVYGNHSYNVQNGALGRIIPFSLNIIHTIWLNFFQTKIV